MGGAYIAKKTLKGYNYFPTYHSLTRLFLDQHKLESVTDLLEPCSGNGDISKILKEYYPTIPVTEFDISPVNKEKITKQDFLKYTKQHEYIVTNPPYNIFLEFYKHSLNIFTKQMCLLLPTDYLHAIERYDIMYKGDTNILKYVYVYIRRPLFSEKYNPAGLVPTGATTFAWFVFDKSYKGNPQIKWIDNRHVMGIPSHEDKINFEIELDYYTALLYN